MAAQVFIDGVGKVRLVDSIIRINFGMLKATEGEIEGGGIEFTQQLVMSPQVCI